ncbi:MAG TPA: hypothetical protein VF710_18000 [Longimicrobium sp.]|jgi:hypothetical protein
MSITVTRLVVPTLALLGACLPAPVQTSGPAPENALSCAQESLRRLGYSHVEMSKSGNSFYARRTADSAWVSKIDHLVNVSTRRNGTTTLHLNGERVYSKDGGVYSPSGAPQQYRMRIEADDLLKSEISQVIQDCTDAAPHSPAAAR